MQHLIFSPSETDLLGPLAETLAGKMLGKLDFELTKAGPVTGAVKIGDAAIFLKCTSFACKEIDRARLSCLAVGVELVRQRDKSVSLGDREAMCCLLEIEAQKGLMSSAQSS